MATQRHLNNAPIREGIIDIHFEPSVSLKALEGFADSVKGQFEKSSKLWQQAFKISLNGAEGSAETGLPGGVIGVRLEAPERGYVVILRTTGFTFSRLEPYEDWTELTAAAKPLWSAFVVAVKPETVNRIAVRYINSLPLPAKLHEFSEYLTAPPTVPAELPQGLGSFVQRIGMVDPENDRQAIITQALEESQPGLAQDEISVFLDIDTFRKMRVDARDTAVWQGLDDLRDFKNKIFFSYITEKTAELLQ